jgi:hypothetical protein
MADRRQRRGAPRVDPYEAAVDRFEKTGQPDSENGKEPEPDPGPDFSASFRKQKWAIVAVGALIAVGGLVQSASSSKRPKLAADCAHSRLVLSATSVKQGSLVTWTATGPADGTVLLAVDVARFIKSVDGTLARQPVDGKPLDATQRAGAERQFQGCRGSGVFGAVVPPGKHTVSLFRVTDTGAEPVASASLRVTESR